MMRGMYAAISGLKAHQTMLDVTANNLANVNTIGYKAQRTTFVDELSQVIRGASGPTSNNGGTNPMEVGLGSMVVVLLMLRAPKAAPAPAVVEEPEELRQAA